MSLSLSQSEENYLKSIFNLLDENSALKDNRVSTNLIAKDLQTKASSVTEMIKKLSDKGLVLFEKYKGCSLTSIGKKEAIEIIRKHRLWETFLVEKLAFDWNEVHDIAEQLEHIKSPILTNKLSVFLNHPKFDPHGEPIPDANGKLPVHKTFPLSEALLKKKYKLAGVTNHDPSFLKYLDSLGAGIGSSIEIKDIQEFDKSMSVYINGKLNTIFSFMVCRNLLVL